MQQKKKDEGVHLGLLDDMDHEAKWNTDAEYRKTELRIQALGAAISCRDWHATEQAYAAIRDKFYYHKTPQMTEHRKHPLALTGYKNGALGMKAGDRVIYFIDGRHGVADEFLPDGDAFVTFDDGSYETVKWNSLYPEVS